MVSGLLPPTRVALFRLAFAVAPQPALLNLAARERNSPVHSSIGTPSSRSAERKAQRASLSDCLLTCGFSSLSLPSRGAFHLSLTVLVHYRSSSVFSLGRWSDPLPTRFLVSRGTHAPPPRSKRLVYRALTVCGHAFQQCSTTPRLAHSVALLAESSGWPSNPARTEAARPFGARGLGSSPFARRYWGNRFFSSPY